MTYVHTGEVLQDLRELVVEGLLRKLHLAHVKTPDARNGIVGVDDRRRLALCTSKNDVHKVFRLRHDLYLLEVVHVLVSGRECVVLAQRDGFPQNTTHECIHVQFLPTVYAVPSRLPSPVGMFGLRPGLADARPRGTNTPSSRTTPDAGDDTVIEPPSVEGM